GCLLVRKSFFHNDVKNSAHVGGGVLGCRGFHSSFRTSQDVSTTMIIQPQLAIDFLSNNQNVKDPYRIDWAKEYVVASISTTVVVGFSVTFTLIEMCRYGQEKMSTSDSSFAISMDDEELMCLHQVAAP
ncbi:argonaute 4-like protein, partial [Tanacetum coccineum]